MFEVVFEDGRKEKGAKVSARRGDPVDVSSYPRHAPPLKVDLGDAHEEELNGGGERRVSAVETRNNQVVQLQPPPAANGQAGAEHKSRAAETKAFVGMRLKRWVLTSRIGAGSFGETFAAVEVPYTEGSSYDGRPSTSQDISSEAKLAELARTREEVCIKIEQESKNVLRLEALALKKAQSCPQVVRYLGSGCTHGMNFLIMEKMGPNLAELRRRSPNGTFNVYSMLIAGISCLKALRGIHELGLVHRDVKPSNFVVGVHSTRRVCYLIDFGLARRFLRSSGEVRAPRRNAGFRGTSRYASLASHQRQELGRVDDLWSLLFMLVEFVTGTLPWRCYKDKADIGKCKEETIGIHLVDHMPREFRPFVAHLQVLKYDDTPSYSLLLDLLYRALQRRGYPADKLVDWEQLPEDPDATKLGSSPPHKQLVNPSPPPQASAAPVRTREAPSAVAPTTPASHGDAGPNGGHLDGRTDRDVAQPTSPLRKVPDRTHPVDVPALEKGSPAVVKPVPTDRRGGTKEVADGAGGGGHDNVVPHEGHENGRSHSRRFSEGGRRAGSDAGRVSSKDNVSVRVSEHGSQPCTQASGLVSPSDRRSEKRRENPNENGAHVHPEILASAGSKVDRKGEGASRSDTPFSPREAVDDVASPVDVSPGRAAAGNDGSAKIPKPTVWPSAAGQQDDPPPSISGKPKRKKKIAERVFCGCKMM